MVQKRKPTFEYEQTLWNSNREYVVGMDEVGRGSLAGPVVVGAVIFPRGFSDNRRVEFVKKVNDSKKLSHNSRAKMVKVIYNHALDWSIGVSTAKEIDGLGIVESVRRAARRAYARLQYHPDGILTDASLLPKRNTQNVTEIIKGDSVSVSIAAASIIAKEWRDSYMARLSQKMPYSTYRWFENAGYGTQRHRDTIRVYGLTDLHRVTFCRGIVNDTSVNS
ncbi:ribonuclease HII [bacterium]|uniref:Ribonuclease n=1 Tax=candidate division WWE3 bacterium CG_4_9_14_3_um_filter_39_7 TaxID=1975080 RepID=A0A2M7X3J4_UNCKA|nr:ribonuclease HII [bacterium]PJA40699.1 MAG: ribonuclease HII [candidate division WWE3 bacterium CG_4_9_14_3_um_filter_39_7]